MKCPICKTTSRHHEHARCPKCNALYGIKNSRKTLPWEDMGVLCRDCSSQYDSIFTALGIEPEES